MGEETTKDNLIKLLIKHKKELTVLIDGFRQLDETDDARLNRIITQKIVFTLFGLVDTLVDVEIDIHNFMKRRG